MNRGAQALSRFLAARGDQVNLARKLGVDQGHISRIARDEKLPGLGLRKLLREHVGIDLEAWDEVCEDPASDAPDTERAAS